MAKFIASRENTCCDTSYDVVKDYGGGEGDGYISTYAKLSDAKKAVISEIDKEIAFLKSEKKRIRSMKLKDTFLSHMETVK